jgi:L-alanine-DL-glutamate epimerase-like enolase superfamily enzyme
MANAAPGNPAARCALETAALDAACRHLDLPMHMLFGGAENGPFETDITLPILGRERCLELADHWHERGFRLLKVKVGNDADSDLGTIEAIARSLPDISFVLDANQGFTEREALKLINALDRARIPVRMIEQPIPKGHLKSMMTLRRAAPFQICADESVSSRFEAMQVIRADAADIINIKIMKCGVVESLEIAALARASGIGVMYGGMVESRVAMGCSLALAAGLGSVHTLDLDTPLLLADDPVEGGFTYDGPRMSVPTEPGLGCSLEHLFRE